MTKYQQLSAIEDTQHSRTPTPSSLPPSYQNDLEAAFDESLHDDDDEEEENAAEETHQLLPPGTSSSSSSSSSSSTTTITTNTGVSSSNRQRSVSTTNDGVFANMSAKPESDKDKKDETPPSYNDAALDATPPYWQTTVIAPSGMGEMILVEGMPVGSLFVFFWNLLVSATFQFVGFLLTYLLHTSHAGKNGARAGLGISVIQFGLYIRSHGSLNSLDQDDMDDDGDADDDNQQHLNTDFVAYFLMILGWFIIVRSVADYLKAKHMEKIIATDPSAVIDQTV
ncbi:hypothetical protein BCR42DRAFT_412062 [Absidia repens]|uniref:Metal homeostatis protein bsd2 n=1 Tax=Absidia repens TaxID=90262 RepID=A0A1X2IMP0_9FUNG|nr:hypothetical protein BCR42DRAFT_412062 [Absidia repens]